MSIFFGRVVGESSDYPDPPVRRKRGRGKRPRMSPGNALEVMLSQLSQGKKKFHYARNWAFGDQHVLDFYVRDVALGIEVRSMGNPSPEREKTNRQRVEILENLGVTLVRISTWAIMHDPKAVTDRLRRGWRAALEGRRGLV